MSRRVESLPPRKQLAYAIGQLGWSTLVNVVGVSLVYFYLPPDSAGLPQLITGATFLGVLNVLTLIAALRPAARRRDRPLDRGHERPVRQPARPTRPVHADRRAAGRRLPGADVRPAVDDAVGVDIAWLVVFQALFFV